MIQEFLFSDTISGRKYRNNLTISLTDLLYILGRIEIIRYLLKFHRVDFVKCKDRVSCDY